MLDNFCAKFKKQVTDFNESWVFFNDKTKKYSEKIDKVQEMKKISLQVTELLLVNSIISPFVNEIKAKQFFNNENMEYLGFNLIALDTLDRQTYSMIRKLSASVVIKKEFNISVAEGSFVLNNVVNVDTDMNLGNTKRITMESLEVVNGDIHANCKHWKFPKLKKIYGNLNVPSEVDIPENVKNAVQGKIIHSKT